MRVYYNDSEPFVCTWLKNLMAAGLIPAGDVDDRPIQEVQPQDLVGYGQCHFFAGIGGWAYALGLADWPATQPVWTGSCPCQPFSAAGKGRGTADERHLWPEWRRLITDGQPPVVFGEQVAAKAGRLWLAAVRADLEGMGYGVGAADLCAAGVEAPHIRQRLYFVADTESQRNGSGNAGTRGRPESSDRSDFGFVGHTDDAGSQGRRERRDGADQCVAGEASVVGFMAYTNGRDASAEGLQRSREHGQQSQNGGIGFWANAEWLPCRDGKWRPVEPGTFPLAHGIPARVGRLRAYGNAIVPQVAAAFVSAYMGVR